MDTVSDTSPNNGFYMCVEQDMGLTNEQWCLSMPQALLIGNWNSCSAELIACPRLVILRRRRATTRGVRRGKEVGFAEW